MTINKKIIIGISASIALYKTPALARRFIEQGAQIKSVMTFHANQLLAAQVMEAVSQQPCYINEFAGRKGPMDHIDLKNWADIMIVYPGSANTIGNFANGIGPDLLSTLFLAFDPQKVLICPAMNTDMFLHPAVQRNIARLKQYGCHILEPDQGSLACGETGPGRLIEPESLLNYVADSL